MATQTINQQALINGSTFCWHEVNVPNAKAAIEFYTKSLGFGTEDVQMEGGRTYHMLTKDGKGVAGVNGSDETKEMKGITPHWGTFLAVDDVDASLAKCVTNGATISVPAMDVPTVGRMGQIKDPFGANIWLFKSSM